MGFSFRPGFAFAAIAIAISIVTSLLFALVAAIFVEVASPQDAMAALMNAPLMGIGAFVLYFGTIFVVADQMWSPLCRWTNSSKQHLA